MVINKQYEKGKISFCVLGYKHRKFIEDCIKSIWEINYPKKEIIVVDDGSNDGSYEALLCFQNQSKCSFTVIGQDNTGRVGYNFNKALEKASGEFVTFISLDDLYNSKEIATMIETMVSNPKLAFNASTMIQGIDSENKHPVDIEELKTNEIHDPSVNDLLELEFQYFGAFYIQGCIFRKEIIDSVNGFDEDMTGDDIILRTKVFKFMIANGLNSFNLHKASSVFYRRHSNNVSNNSVRQMKIVSEYYERYWPDRENSELFYTWYLSTLNPDTFKQLKTMNERMKDAYYYISKNTDLIFRFFFRVYKDIIYNGNFYKIDILNELYGDVYKKSKKMIIIHYLFKIPFGKYILQILKIQ